MRALTYHGAHSVKVDTVPDPVIQESDDVILRVTATAICGSDLHLYGERFQLSSMAISLAMSLWGSLKRQAQR